MSVGVFLAVLLAFVAFVTLVEIEGVREVDFGIVQDPYRDQEALERAVWGADWTDRHGTRP